jgi:hypothetical protein
MRTYDDTFSGEKIYPGKVHTPLSDIRDTMVELEDVATRTKE